MAYRNHPTKFHSKRQYHNIHLQIGLGRNHHSPQSDLPKLISHVFLMNNRGTYRMRSWSCYTSRCSGCNDAGACRSRYNSTTANNRAFCNTPGISYLEITAVKAGIPGLELIQCYSKIGLNQVAVVATLDRVIFRTIRARSR